MPMLLFYLLFTIKSIKGDPHCEDNDSKGNCIRCEDSYGVLKDKNSGLNGWCIKCLDIYCNSCNDDASICEGCELNYTLDKDHTSSTYKKCVSCPPNCESCTLNNCTGCKKGFGFGPNFECIKCESPFCEHCYNDYKKCEECSKWHGNERGYCYRCLIDSCSDCQSNIRDCHRCENDLVFDYNSRKCRKCEERFQNCDSCKGNICEYCKRGYYKLPEGGCVPCSEGCENCRRDDGGCYSCNDNYVLVASKCVLCTQYDPNCERCDSDDALNVECIICKEGFVIGYDGKCVKSTIENCWTLNEDGTCNYCLEDYGPDENAQCSKCPEGCPECIEDHTKCSTEYCKNGYEYIEDEQICSKCPDNCFQCNKQPKCVNCNLGYGVTEDGLCSPCAIPNCTWCDKNYKTCTLCEGPLIYDPIKNVCSDNCSDPNCLNCNHDNGTICFGCANGTYLSKNQCIKCSDPNCIYCKNVVCEECKDGYVLQGGKCSKCIVENCFNCYGSFNNICDVCMPGYGTVSSQCVQCKDKNCATCINGIEDCRSCLPGFGLHLINGSSNYGECISCDVGNCSKCDGNVSICTECKDNFYLIDNKCDENPNIEESIYPGDEDDFPTWAIVVIVVVGVVVIGVVIFLIVYFCKKKKIKVGADSSSV